MSRPSTMLLGLAMLLASAGAGGAQTTAPTAPTESPSAHAGQEAGGSVWTAPDLTDRRAVASAARWLVVVTVIAVAPAVAVLVTSFTRIVVVLGLLRQGLGTAQLPPNTVLFGLALLVSLVVMAPVFSAVWADAVEPYADGRMALPEAVGAGEAHVRKFMIGQIESAGSADEVYLFLGEDQAGRDDLTWRDVPTRALLPAFVISELKVAFVLGFQILLPFVVIDVLVASVLTSMGMLMLPPVLVSLPLKLLLFVTADGWRLVVGNVMTSFGPAGGGA